MTPNEFINNFTIETILIFAVFKRYIRGKSYVRHFFGEKKAKKVHFTSSKILLLLLAKPNYNHSLATHERYYGGYRSR